MTSTPARLRHLAPWLALTCLVVVSTAIRAAAARSFTVPWVAPDEMLYGLIGESLWDTGTLTVRGLETPYYSLLYPAFVGLPLTLLDVADGIRLAQVVQAFVMSLTAVPVYVWGRRFLSDLGALSAAVLALAVPAMAYSGLLMTEALYYPLLAVALFALARTLEEPTMWRQGVFMATLVVAASVRLQALILLPAFVLAAFMHARMTRSTATLTRLLPLLGAFFCLAVLSLVALAALEDFSWADMLGAYGTLGEESGLSAGALEEVVWHTAGLAVLTVGIPLLVTAVLVGHALRRRENDLRAASFLATTGAYVPLLVVQVAAFAAGHLDHVSERYLVTAAPPLFLGLVLWVERGAPRPALLLGACGALLTAALVVVPADRIARPQGIQDALSSDLLVKLADAASPGWVRAALVVAGIAAVAVAAFTPRRAAPAVIALVGVVLAIQAVVATRDVARASGAEFRKANGSDSRSWIDDREAEGATLLATNDRPWTADARTFFWNRAIGDVITLDGATRPVPPSAVVGALRERDGLVLDATGAPIQRREVVAPTSFVLNGTKLAEAPAAGAETVGLVLWRVDGPIRIAQRRSGFLPNGDITQSAFVIVPACRPGTLELTLLGKSGAPIDMVANGITVKTIAPPAGAVVAAKVPAPPDVDGTRQCVFELRTNNLVGTTRVEYVPDG